MRCRSNHRNTSAARWGPLDTGAGCALLIAKFVSANCQLTDTFVCLQTDARACASVRIAARLQIMFKFEHVVLQANCVHEGGIARGYPERVLRVVGRVDLSAFADMRTFTSPR